MTDLDYLISKVEGAQILNDPYPHVHIEDFLSETHFKEMVTSPAINLPASANVAGLFDNLSTAGFEPIAFPGCTTDKAQYSKWLETFEVPKGTHKACEAQGMTLRHDGTTDAGVPLDAFFKTQAWQDVVRDKFGITKPTRVEAGLQKYLQGYEISPHPDIRDKALTWMLNLNPADNSEDLDIHTHYLKFKPERSYIYDFWANNLDVETSWVPWDWCTTVKRQTANNSIVIFSPNSRTLHAVRARYDHLATQRTQMYGNLWYEPTQHAFKPQFADLDIVGGIGKSTDGPLTQMKDIARASALKFLASRNATWPPKRALK